MSESSGDARIRVAIIGSGPAGSYAAGHLLRHSEPELHVDLYERLPTPWGLVRAGVAPDHPKIKSVTNLYERTAEHPRFRLFANVEFGRDVTLAELRERYHAIVYAVGTPTDRSMGIPGEELPGSYSATDFVGWYNGHPDFCDLEFDLSGKRVLVVGAGNVALDVARMLVLTRDELAVTDVADHALDVLASSGVREVVVVARRGPAQAAFTNPELRELGELVDADVIVDEAEMGSGVALEDPAADPTARRNVEICATTRRERRRGGASGSSCASCSRRWSSAARGTWSPCSWRATCSRQAPMARFARARPTRASSSRRAPSFARSATAGRR